MSHVISDWVPSRSAAMRTDPAAVSGPPTLDVHVSGAKGLFLPVSQTPAYADAGTTARFEEPRTLKVHIAFGKSVRESAEAAWVDEASDLVIDFTTTLEGEHPGLPSDFDSLLTIYSPILIYLSMSSPNGLGRSLVAAAIVDFRYALLPLGDSGSMSVELLQCDRDGTSLGVEAGVLYVGLGIRGLPASTLRDVMQDIGGQQRIEKSISAFQETVANANRVLYRNAKLFWSNMKQAYPYVEKRNVRILQEDECCSHRFACSMVSRIAPSRDLSSARAAARFVSLIPVTQSTGLTGEPSSGCNSAFATLCKREGSIEDHAVLLCSLLLGWGLDAWVVLGSAVSPDLIAPKDTHSAQVLEAGHHCWVATFATTDLGSRFPKVTFWESTTGKQYEDITFLSDSTSHSHHFREVHAMYNHESFVLNIQRNASVDASLPSAAMSFAVEDDRCFQALGFHPDSRRTLAHPGTRIAIQASRLGNDELQKLEISLESYLRQEFKSWRDELGQSTTFEPTISTILQAAIYSYEGSKLGIAAFDADFKAALGGFAHKDDTFTAFAKSFNHVNESKIASSLKTDKTVRGILMSSDGIRQLHALRVRVFAYPEGVLAVWVMIAVCAQQSYKH